VRSFAAARKLTGVLAALAALAACRKPTPAPPPLLHVRVVELSRHSIQQTFEWLATLDGSTNAEIRPRVEGYIESVDYQEGSVVEKGALLFTLDKRPLAAARLRAQGGYENALAQLHKAQADVARYTPLAASHAISREELDNARAAAEVATANVRAAQGALASATLNLDFTNVRAPIPGIAGIAQTRVGNLVDPAQVLTVVSTVDPIRASYHISEAEYLGHAEVLNHINDPQYASSRYLELILSDGRVHPYRAQRVIVNRMIDPTTGTLLIQALFPNPGNILRPGLFARVRVHTGRPVEALLLPKLAVQELQGSFRVAIVDSEGRAAVRTVKLGRALDDSYVVEEGLSPGERVIVEGQQNVQPGMKVAAEPARLPTGRR